MSTHIHTKRQEVFIRVFKLQKVKGNEVTSSGGVVLAENLSK